jgi:hypothetical protein
MEGIHTNSRIKASYKESNKNNVIMKGMGAKENTIL